MQQFAGHDYFVPLVPSHIFGYPKSSLGKGTYGEVKLHDNISELAINYGLTGKSYAIKKCREKSMWKEIAACYYIRSNNINRLVAISDDGCQMSLVYDLAECSLSSYIDEAADSKEGLDKKLCRKFAIQLATSLRDIHAGGVIHRDLKPDNALLVPNEEGELVAKWTDFGISWVYGYRSECDDDGVVQCYGAPEVMLGRIPYTDKSDIWSFGCNLYYLFTGQKLFTDIGSYWTPVLLTLGQPPTELTENTGFVRDIHIDSVRPSLSIRLSKFPRDVAEVITACVSYMPNDRPTLEWIILTLSEEHGVIQPTRVSNILVDRRLGFHGYLSSSTTSSASVIDLLYELNAGFQMTFMFTAYRLLTIYESRWGLPEPGPKLHGLHAASLEIAATMNGRWANLDDIDGLKVSDVPWGRTSLVKVIGGEFAPATSYHYLTETDYYKSIRSRSTRIYTINLLLLLLASGMGKRYNDQYLSMIVTKQCSLVPKDTIVWYLNEIKEHHIWVTMDMNYDTVVSHWD